MNRSSSLREYLQRFEHWAGAPVHSGSLVLFRIAFGSILLWEVVRYWQKGWIERYWVVPSYNFPYPFFEWLTPGPAVLMRLLFILLGVAAIGIALGFYYRLATLLFFLGFTYTFLLEEARYLNHFYLVVLLSFLVVFLPLHASTSIDARRRREDRSKASVPRVHPRWHLLLLRFQIAVPYVFGGVAKLNEDWLHGEPMRMWLGKRTDIAVLGRLFEEEWMVFLFTYGGLWIDLLVVPLLLLRRTATVTLVAVTSFHLLNVRLFSIGIFPWLMLAATTLFLPPDWPSELWRDLREGSAKRRLAYATSAGLVAVASIVANQRFEFAPFAVGCLIGAVILYSSRSQAPRRDATLSAGDDSSALRLPRSVSVLVCLWIAVQIAIPLRHLLIPGVVHWTEEGHRFAWHMKLRSKKGTVVYVATNPTTGERERIDPRPLLEPWQYRKMATRPYMIKQFAEHLSRQKLAEGWQEVEIRAEASVSLNGRPHQPLVDPGYDLLVAEEHCLRPADWILPLRPSS